MEHLVFFVYRWLLAPWVAAVAVIFRPLLKGKLRTITEARLKNKWTQQNLPNSHLKNVLWIHAASGEIEYARSVLRSLKERHPRTPIVVTYTSPSAERILQRIPELDAWGYSPWDLPGSCSDFLDKIQPIAVLFSRTDVWPELIHQIHRRKIPSLLFSATFSETSSRLKGFSKYLTKKSFGELREIHVVDQEDLQVLSKKNCPLEHVKITGDTRYDQVEHRLKNPQPVRQELKPDCSQKVLVAGSTWPEDEAILLEWLQTYPSSLKILLAPHEVSKSRLDELKENLRQRNLNFQLYSEAEKWISQILVLDRIGILAELYTWGDFAFVGGSFKKQVHSVMEPLAAGLPVLVGPFHSNNREAMSFQKIITPEELAIVQVIHDSQEIEASWQKLQEINPIHLKDFIQKQVRSRRGATDKVLLWLDASISI